MRRRWQCLSLLMLICTSVCLVLPSLAKDKPAIDDEDSVSMQRDISHGAKSHDRHEELETDHSARRRRRGHADDKGGRGHHDEEKKPSCYAECHASCSRRSDGVTAAMCEQSCARFCGGYSGKETLPPGHSPPHSQRPPLHTTVPGIYYGAIAIAPSKLVYATNTGSLTQVAAEQNALQSCRQQVPEWPDDCRIALWFRGTCAALALMDDPQRVDWGWAAAWGTGKSEAEAQALIKCNSHTTRKACVVVTSVCAR